MTFGWVVGGKSEESITTNSSCTKTGSTKYNDSADHSVSCSKEDARTPVRADSGRYVVHLPRKDPLGDSADCPEASTEKGPFHRSC